jgi:hypothetical protein
MNAVEIEAAVSELVSQKPDGVHVDAEDLLGGDAIACAYAYADFPKHFGFFLPLAGISAIKEIKDNPVDVCAKGRLETLFELCTKMVAADKAKPALRTTKGKVK